MIANIANIDIYTLLSAENIIGVIIKILGWFFEKYQNQKYSIQPAGHQRA